MELTREVIKLNHVIGKDRTQVMMESDIIVPDSKPDVLRVLQNYASCYVDSYEVMQDKININLKAKVEILYVGEEKVQPMYAMVSNGETSTTLNIQGARIDSNCLCSCKVEHVDCRVVNSRKLNIRIIMSVEGICSKDEKIPVVTDVPNDNSIQLLKNKLKLNSIIGNIKVPIYVGATENVPDTKAFIGAILKSSASVVDRNIQMLQNQAVCKGTLRLNVVYISEPPESQVEFLQFDIPFDEVIDVPGSREGINAESSIEIDEVNVTAKQDEDGDTSIMDVRVGMKAKILAYEEEEKNVVADAYSLKNKLTVERKNLKLREIVEKNSLISGLKDNFPVGEGIPSISNVFNVNAMSDITAIKIEGNKVVLEGVIGVNILYHSDDPDRPVQNIYKEFPVKQVIDMTNIDDSMTPEGYFEIRSVDYVIISNREIEIKVNFVAYTAVYRDFNRDLIVDMNLENDGVVEMQNIPSIVVYIVQKGDNLWNIAKRYFTTVDKLTSINNILDKDKIMPGQKIYIFKSLNA